MFAKSKRVALGVVLAAPAAGAAATADASALVIPKTEQHCVGIEQTPDQVTMGEIPEVACFATFAEAMDWAGVSAGAGESLQAVVARNAGAGGSAASFGTSILAYHFDSFNGAGSYLYFVGTDCDGGGANLPGTGWDNHIRSTTSAACSNVKHFAEANWGSGDAQITDPVNINMNATMDRRTSSLRFVG